MLHLKNSFVKLYLFLLILLIVCIVALFAFSNNTLTKEEKEIINIEKLHAQHLAKKIEEKIVKIAPKDLTRSLQKNKSLREYVNELLSLFSNAQYKYVYLVYLDKNGAFRYLADGSYDVKERGDWHQIFTPISPVWGSVIKSKKPNYTLQKDISNLWVTYLYPFNKYKNEKIILVFDISMQEYKTLMQILKPIQKLLILMSILLIIILLSIVLQTFIYFKQRKKSNIDPLTHLYNRNYLDEIKKHIDLRSCAIALADIDHFKQINDRYGHDIGDIVLETIAKRLMNATRTFDILIRYGGEEFLIFFTKKVNIETIKSISNRILTTISSQPIRVNNKNLNVTISIGVNPTPYKNKSLEDAIINADKMLYIAKTGGRNRVVINNNKISTKHILLLDEITNAIKQNRLEAYFQPILNIKSNKIVKYEALARIVDKNGDIFSPAQFLPMIKRTTIYRTLTKIMLVKAFSMIKKHNISVSVNFDIGDFFDDTIYEMLTDLINKNIKYSHFLTIEILEDMPIYNNAKFTKRIDALKKFNIQIAIDDFGSGYSGFNYIINIKPDILKIDGSIILKILKDENAKTILKSISEICQSLKIKSIAEFVENEDILKILEEYDINMAQGYFIGKPFDPKEGKTKTSPPSIKHSL